MLAKRQPLSKFFSRPKPPGIRPARQKGSLRPPKWDGGAAWFTPDLGNFREKNFTRGWLEEGKEAGSAPLYPRCFSKGAGHGGQAQGGFSFGRGGGGWGGNSPAKGAFWAGPGPEHKSGAGGAGRKNCSLHCSGHSGEQKGKGGPLPGTKQGGKTRQRGDPWQRGLN